MLILRLAIRPNTVTNRPLVIFYEINFRLFRGFLRTQPHANAKHFKKDSQNLITHEGRAGAKKFECKVLITVQNDPLEFLISSTGFSESPIFGGFLH